MDQEEEKEALNSLLARTSPRGKLWYPRPSMLQAQNAEGATRNVGQDSNPTTIMRDLSSTSTTNSPFLPSGTHDIEHHEDIPSHSLPTRFHGFEPDDQSDKDHYPTAADDLPVSLTRDFSGATSSTVNAAYTEPSDAWHILNNEGEWHLASTAMIPQRELKCKLVGELKVFSSEGQLLKIAITAGTKNSIIYARFVTKNTMLLPRSAEAYEVRTGLQREDFILVPEKPGELSRRVGASLESGDVRPILWIENLETGQTGNSLLDDVLSGIQFMK